MSPGVKTGCRLTYVNDRFIEPDEIAFEERIGATTLTVARQVEV